MQFFLNNKLVHPRNRKTIQPYCFLNSDNWDDFGFKTIFALTYIDSARVEHEIGSLHIGRIGQEAGRVELPVSFEKLENEFFSLGVSADFYKNLRTLGDSVRIEILTRLRDLAYMPELLEQVRNEAVFVTSFLRSKHLSEIEEQFHRVANGDVFNSEYAFTFVINNATSEKAELTFNVEPYSDPPTNIHAIIGRNAVGKSQLLQAMSELYLFRSKSDYVASYAFEEASSFKSLVTVAFSPFDNFTPISYEKSFLSTKDYVYVGLKVLVDGQTRLLNLEELDNHFRDASQSCAQPGKRGLWKSVIERLETDPLLREYEFGRLASDEDKLRLEAIAQFNELSSGHKIVLLTMAKLVQNVAEQSLVLLDEPELHLHPPLLSSFMRALSHLMREQNGVAVIATHSPVVLQEIPKQCSWILRRSGDVVRCFRPTVETFGESIGALTHDVFELEATDSGFYAFLQELVMEGLSRNEIFERLDNQLGSEGRAVLAALLSSRKK